VRINRALGTAAMTACAAVLLAAPASAKQHGQAFRVALQACKQERSEGRTAFVEKYGQPALRNCLRATVEEARNAAEACRTEREKIGLDAFREEYGKNHNKRNAFGKCVSEAVTAEEPPEGETAGDAAGAGDEGCAADEPATLDRKAGDEAGEEDPVGEDDPGEPEGEPEDGVDNCAGDDPAGEDEPAGDDEEAGEDEPAGDETSVTGVETAPDPGEGNGVGTGGRD
jgi:hypothetical protein